MTGIEKMINQILEEAKNSANEQLGQAEAKVKEILGTAETEAKKQAEVIAAQSKTDIELYKERIRSMADLERRNALLGAKQEVISETLEKAYKIFCGLDEKEYFAVIKKMVGLFAEPQNGTICFSSKDLKRLPDGFSKEIGDIAQSKGGNLSISEEVRKIEGGFILVYGGIEENCSFRALFDSKINELQDMIQKEIFS